MANDPDFNHDNPKQAKDFGARTIRRFTGWVERKMPTRTEMERNKYLKPIAHRFLRSELWRFTRRSVPRGVALGMLTGFLIPVGQIFGAAFLALPVRANVPIAMITTFITNPFTYPFWIIAARQTGQFILRIDAMTDGRHLNTQLGSEFGQWLSWIVREAGVTAFGFLVFAIVFASVGYVASSLLWSWWINKKRKRRLKKFAAYRATSSQGAKAGREKG